MPSRTLRILITLALTALIGGCASSPAYDNAGPDFESGRKAYIAEDYERALPLLTAEAERGTPRAQYAVGVMYYHGLGVEADRRQGISWIRRAANNGDPLAVEALSRLAVTMTRNTPSSSSSEGEDEDGASGEY